MKAKRTSFILLAALALTFGLFGCAFLGPDFKAGKEKFDHGDYRGALEEWEKDTREAKRRNQEIFMMIGLSNLGKVHHYMGDYPKSLSCSTEALKIAREVGNREVEGGALGTIGLVFLRLHDYPKALLYHEQALKIAKEKKDRQAEQNCLTNIGIVHQELGDYPKALSSYNQALEIHKSIGNKSGQILPSNSGGSLYLSIGNFYLAMGDNPKALAYYEQAFKIAEEVGDRRLAGAAQSNIGLIYHEAGEYAKALSHYEKALRMRKEVGVPTYETEICIGAIYSKTGEMDRAYSFFNGLAEPMERSLNLGGHYLTIKDYQKARSHFFEILPKAEKQRTADHLLTAYIGLGLSFEGLKDFKKAGGYFLKAVQFIEKQREGLTEAQRRNFFSAGVRSFHRIDPYDGLVRVSFYLKDIDEALYWAESTKARYLLEAVTRRSGTERLGITDELSRQESAFINRMAALKGQMDLAFEKNPERYRRLEKELAGIEKDRDAFVARLRREYPEYASIRYPEPMRVADFQLEPGEALIEYQVTEKEAFAWLVRGRRVAKAIGIPVAKRDLTELVKQYRRSFEGATTYGDLTRFEAKAGKELYDLLIKELASELKPGEPLIIVPHDILGILPFEALVASIPAHPEMQTGEHGPYPAGLTYLGDQHPICTYQSATALSIVRTLGKRVVGKRDKMLVLADPLFDSKRAGGEAGEDEYSLRRRSMITVFTEEPRGGERRKGVVFDELPSTRLLADKLKASDEKGVDVLRGAKATERQLRGRPLDQYRYQIFATHGILDNDIPYIKEPALVLSQVGVEPNDHEQDGFLTMTEVMDLRMDAELVALTACNTGVGKNLSGEGVMGMGRAFQYAGSRAVLISLWSVEDESTNLLTEKYFAHLKAGKDRLEALRLARKDVRQAGYEHPFFWAPFILVGEK